MKAESRSLRCQATTEAPQMVGSKWNTSEVQSSTPHTLLDGRPWSKTAIPIWARPPQSFVCFFFASGNITDDGKPIPELVKNLVDLLPLQRKLSVLSGLSSLVGKHYCGNLCGFLESQSQGGVLQLLHEIDFWDIFNYNSAFGDCFQSPKDKFSVWYCCSKEILVFYVGPKEIHFSLIKIFKKNFRKYF